MIVTGAGGQNVPYKDVTAVERCLPATVSDDNRPVCIFALVGEDTSYAECLLLWALTFSDSCLGIRY